MTGDHIADLTKSSSTIGEDALLADTATAHVSPDDAMQGSVSLNDVLHAKTPPLLAEHIRVRSDRVEVSIRVSSRHFSYTDEILISRVLKEFPTLGMHACRNHKGVLFSDVMNNTSVPHLLEHMVVDRQTRQSSDEERVFTGTTQWSCEDELVAQIVFSYEDDLIALDALNYCLAFLNELLIDERSK